MRYLYVLCRHGKPIVICNSYGHAEYHKIMKQHVYGDDDSAYRTYDVSYSYYIDKEVAVEDYYKGYRSVVYNHYLKLINKLGVYKGCTRLLGVLQETEERRNLLSREYERLSKRVSSLELSIKQLEEFNEALIMRLKDDYNVDL